jgi:hypothetical protein
MSNLVKSTDVTEAVNELHKKDNANAAINDIARERAVKWYPNSARKRAGFKAAFLEGFNVAVAVANSAAKQRQNENATK